MARSLLPHVRMAGCSLITGEIERRIDDEPEYFNHDPALLARLKKSTGLDRRWVALPETTTADLCLAAAKTLLRKLDADPASIDAVVSVTQTPDYPMPGNAHVLHAALALPKSAAAVDVQFGCSGYVYGLWLAAMMLNAGLKRVLLLAGDTLSKAANPRDRTLAPLFGDAGSATLLEYAENAPPMHFILRSDGTGLEKMYVPAGAYRRPSTPASRTAVEITEGCLRAPENLLMDGFAIFDFTLSEQPGLFRDILAFAGKTAADIDCFILHQANSYIVETIRKSAGIGPEKAPSHIFSLYGNQNAASIPGVLCGALADRLTESGAEAVLQGYGIGLSWAACQTRLQNLVCCPSAPRTGGE